MTTLRTEALTISAGTRVLVQDLSVSVGSGEFLAILGRNGCGKSLTLHALAGLSAPRHGRIYLDEVDMRDLLRSALAPPPGAVAPDLLHGVQRKLRRRSRGKFYGDGWSTARAPRSTYLVTSVLMLVLIGFVFLVLIPWGSGALP